MSSDSFLSYYLNTAEKRLFPGHYFHKRTPLGVIGFNVKRCRDINTRIILQSILDIGLQLFISSTNLIKLMDSEVIKTLASMFYCSRSGIIDVSDLRFV